MMKESKYIDKIKREDSLLSLPQSLSQILSMVGTDDFSMSDLSKVILQDPGMTSKVLKMANSAFYGQRSQISTVHQAVMMLGAMQVKCLALSASVFQTDRLEKAYSIDFKELFSHFISVAIGCKMLAGVTGFRASEEAFIAGLLHDIGMVFFIHHFPEDYQAVFQQIDQHPSLIDAEKHVLGIDHATIGEMLAQKWNFPSSLCTAIGSHHDIPDHVEPNNIVHLVQLSELINKSGLDNRSRNLEQRLRTISRFAEQMKIERQKLDEISCSIAAETIKTAEYLGIDIGDPAEILMRANRELFNSFVTIENLFRERRDLSQRILAEERRVAMMETKNVAIATLSHYINNATMAISGRSQLIRMLVANGSIVDKENRLTAILDVIENSVKKVIAVLYELRDLTNLDEMEKYSESKAINIDDRIKQRMTQIEGDLSEIMTKSAPSNA